MSENKSAKKQKQMAVSIAILEIIEKEGLLGVTHSKVSRRSKVSRAWIYEYIGKERAALVEFGAEVFGSHIARAELPATPKTKAELERQLNEGVEFLFESLAASPVLIKLYFRFRGAPNSIGNVIQKYEKKWLNNASKAAAEVLSLDADQAELLAETILTLRLGFAHRFATSDNPKLTLKRARKVFEHIHSMIGAVD